VSRIESLLVAVILSVAWLLVPAASLAGIHTWDVREVFSNADGTIQFVELWEADGGSSETGVGNGSVSSNTQFLSIGNGPVAPPTTHKFYLLGTAAFAALPGAPTPDKIIPAGNVPFFNTGGDTVAFVGFDSWNFGTVPTNGISSLDRISGVGVNSPTNYAGQTGSVDLSATPTVPMLPPPMLTFAMLLVLGVGAGFLVTRRAPAR
jgi:hypothetical protein